MVVGLSEDNGVSAYSKEVKQLSSSPTWTRPVRLLPIAGKQNHESLLIDGML